METKERFVNFSHIKQMQTRYEIGLTHRQAIVNMAKDEYRSISGNRELNRMTIHNCIENSMAVLKQQMKGITNQHLLYTITNVPELNVNTLELTGFGKWLIALCKYHVNMSDKQYESIIEDVIKKLS